MVPWRVFPLSLLSLAVASAEPKDKLPAPKVHELQSKHLGGAATKAFVQLPRNFDPKKRYRVLYILPVVDGETSGQARWGKPLEVARKHNLADKYDCLCVMATFPRGTLYANHPTDPTRQDEDYFVKDVVPFIDQHYPTITSPRGRLLTGFCGSGNGAMWMLLRHLDLFGKAAVWDTWLDMSKMHPPDKKQLGDEETFQEYCVMNLVQKHSKVLKNGPTRIVMMAYRNKRDAFFSVNRFHEKLFDLGIPHIFEFHTKEDHRWDSGWLPRAIAYLFLEDLPENTGR